MPSGTAEPDCRDHPAEASPVPGTAVSGADAPKPVSATPPPSADGAPLTEATKITARATLYPSVNHMATVGCISGSTAVI